MQHSIAMFCVADNVSILGCQVLMFFISIENIKILTFLTLNHKINLFFTPVHGACNIYQVFMTVLVSLST